MRHLEVTANEANAHVVSMFTLPLLVLLVGVGSVDTPSEGERSILPVGVQSLEYRKQHVCSVVLFISTPQARSSQTLPDAPPFIPAPLPLRTASDSVLAGS